MECVQSEEMRETPLAILATTSQDDALEIIALHILLLDLILPVTIQLLLLPFVHPGALARGSWTCTA